MALLSAGPPIFSEIQMALHYFGPFSGDFSTFRSIEKHGDYSVMTDGFTFLVYDEPLKTVRWRDISENNARKYAKTEARWRARQASRSPWWRQ